LVLNAAASNGLFASPGDERLRFDQGCHLEILEHRRLAAIRRVHMGEVFLAAPSRR
jgi:hypothetical protein